MDVKTITFEGASEFKHLNSAPIAFFCAEYAFDEDASMYAGGLGVLAGDFILESAEENLPFVAIGLWYGGPKTPERAKAFSLLEKNGVPVNISVLCGEDNVSARVWVRRFGKSTFLCLLDTNFSSNSPANQIITEHLYDMDFQTNLKQGMMRGVGGVMLLNELGIKPSVYHLNEGHTAFAGLELIAESMRNNKGFDVKSALESIKEKVVATKHTIFSVAGPSMHIDELRALIGSYCKKNYISINDIFELGARKDVEHVFSTTQFLLNCAKRQNGVSAIHVEFEKMVHPNSVLFPITNGVYQKRWQAEEFSGNVETMSDKDFLGVKSLLRKRLVDFVNTSTGSRLSPDVCTVVWARRFASYKRPDLMFSDLIRLKELFTGKNPIQFIISGKAHQSDIEAIKIVERIKTLAKDPAWEGKIAYLSDYSVSLADKLVKGADVWLNTPVRGKEACGTSGMKAGLNGALEVSVSDGWIDEVNWNSIGWILPEENTVSVVYDLIEKEIAPLFYANSDENPALNWANRMRKTIKTVESGFTARRMLKDYLRKAYMVI